MADLRYAHTICFPCAIANGATWPQVHRATVWEGRCDVCQSDLTLPTGGVCSVSDWNWPKGKRPTAFSVLDRD